MAVPPPPRGQRLVFLRVPPDRRAPSPPPRVVVLRVDVRENPDRGHDAADGEVLQRLLPPAAATFAMMTVIARKTETLPRALAIQHPPDRPAATGGDDRIRARGPVALKLPEPDVHALHHPPHPALDREPSDVLVHLLLLKVRQDALRRGEPTVRPGDRAHPPRAEVRIHALQIGRLRRLRVRAVLVDGPVRVSFHVLPRPPREDVIPVADHRQGAFPKHALRARPLVPLEDAVSKQELIPRRARVVAVEKVAHLLHGAVLPHRSREVFGAAVRQDVTPRAVTQPGQRLVHHLAPSPVGLEDRESVRHVADAVFEVVVIPDGDLVLHARRKRRRRGGDVLKLIREARVLLRARLRVPGDVGPSRVPRAAPASARHDSAQTERHDLEPDRA
mmetsp:Transcript_9020/g.32917  ORF Transcript_9020/g.32917 Transcript_9020/m.32917 type:complete len:390 (+) Transcript_9020:252-1421(+)|eukprot:31089-Pelagococcus_subviridis.AAC.15